MALGSFVANAQYDVHFLIKNKDNNQAVPHASVVHNKSKTGTTADSLGTAIIKNLPLGKQTFTISSLGFEEKQITIILPLATTSPIEILMEANEEEEEMEEVVIRATRSSRSIKNLPTRVEMIDAEELDEKNNMRPANISMLLHESTGIQVLQTSATSGNASIRIQGLDGRYTQILKDGFPNFSGFSGGLSILEIPPLDLKQVEVIKGPASTLYGGGAIAGVVNFVSVEPGEKNQTKLLFNQSHVGQSNLGFFTSQKKGKIGFTLLTTGNLQKAYDVDKDDFTELPKTKDLSLSPKLFFYINDKSQLIVGHTLTTADRRGGDLQVLKGRANNEHTYFENNKTARNITNVEYRVALNSNNKLTARQSLSFFNRSIEVPNYRFRGLQTNAYTDISNATTWSNHTLITGVNFIYDNFAENKGYSGANRSDRNITGGVYAQDTWDATDKLSFENGLRIDVSNRYGAFVLPRLSGLYKISNNVSSRLSVGMGYKLPTIFTEQTEALQYQNIAPIENTNAEKSYGGTADINFKKRVSSNWEISLNQLFFYSIITNPLILQQRASDIHFVNAEKSTQSYGFETNAKFIYRNTWKLFSGYTYNFTKASWRNGNQFLPIVPKHKLNLALIYEKHDFLKVGLEGYLTGNQYLNNGMRTPSFWEFGFMVEKPFKHFSLFVNFENFTDQRQSKYKRVVNGSHSNPSFDDIWNHTEGFVVNGGIKINW
jgi:outer membrane receptor for ferrienterochelin and colicins